MVMVVVVVVVVVVGGGGLEFLKLRSVGDNPGALSGGKSRAKMRADSIYYNGVYSFLI